MARIRRSATPTVRTTGRHADGNSVQGPDSHFRCLMIRASAGTGKTYQLSSRYISLLRTSAPDVILASTFTRKAAGEILERILCRLAEAALNSEKLNELGAAVGSPTLTRDECLSMLARLTRALHRVRIGTLDSFFARLVGSHSLELGLPVGWRMADESVLRAKRSEAIGAVFEAGTPEALAEVVHWLAKGQAARSVTELLETAVKNMYSAYLSAPPAAWERMPEPQFLTNKQRETLIARLQNLTFSDKRFAKARDRDLEIILNNQWENLIAGGFAKAVLSGERTYFKKELSSEIVEIYGQLNEQARAVSLAVWRSRSLATRRILDDYHRLYEASKLADLSLEFQDLTRLLSRGTWSPSAVQVSYRLDAGIEHLLLDEFQDTSPEQWKVLRPFAEDVCRNPSGAFFCVGDRKQAIYGWRGGEAAIFDAIERQLPHLESQPLDMSRRSSPPVIDAVNQVMQGLVRHDNLADMSDVLRDWSSSFPEHSTAKTELPGYVQLKVIAAPLVEDDRKLSKGEKEPFLLAEVAKEVKRLRKLSPQSSIGVLTRSNARVGATVATLNEQGIEASEEGGNPITDSAAVETVLSLLTLADHPASSAALFHVANSPLGRAYGVRPDLDEAETRALALRVRRDVLDLGYGGFVHRLLTPLAGECSPREFRRLSQLASLGDAFDASFSTLRPSEFVEYIREQKLDAPQAAAVRVMTIHQAKGLEFDIVLLVELDKNVMDNAACYALTEEPGGDPVLVCPSETKEIVELIGGEPAEARRQTQVRDLTESLCLLYVAMTRAVHCLTMFVLPDGKKDKLPQTFSGLLRASLAEKRPADPGVVLWEHGDRDWFKKISRDASASVPRAGSGAAEADERRSITFQAARKDKDLPRVAPSQTSSARAIPVSAVLGEVRESRLDKGTLFHRWCESIQWLSGTSVDLDLSVPTDLGFLPESERKRFAKEFRAAVATPAIRTVFNQSARLERLTGLAGCSQDVELEVRNEFRFTMATTDGLVNGSMDRLVLCRQQGKAVAAELVDFKSDAIDGDTDRLRERVQSYRPQLQAYRLAVSRLFELPSERIMLQLAFLSEGEVIEV